MLVAPRHAHNAGVPIMVAAQRVRAFL